MILIFLANSALADDPGARDSVIVETVYAELGDSTVDVRIYATSDDSVYFYNFPLTWISSSEAGIFPVDVSYFNLILYWFIYDTLLYDQMLFRMLGWCNGHGEPPLVTNNQRMHCWTLHFHVDSLNLPQYVGIDTTFDDLNGSLLFALGDGTTHFAPVFIPGAIYYGITSEANEDKRILPDGITLLQSYPNPFNASTNIKFTLPKEVEIELSIYDLLGREVTVLEQGLKSAGNYEIFFNASGLSSGVYFYRLRAGDAVETKRMVLLK
jgi:hypothetical protein